jgi:DNA invertase Pin-like site-specific DNA recombinase
VKECEARELELISLREKIDTTSATGRAFLAIRGAIAQMERRGDIAQNPRYRRPRVAKTG